MTTPILERLFSLRGKTALITGASGGIGRVLAVAFAEAGAFVAIHGRREAELAETSRQIIELQTPDSVPHSPTVLTADLADESACRDLIPRAVHALGRLDILVNCAGMNRRKPIEQVTEDDFDTIMAVNLRSAMILCESAHEVMKRQGGGKIINIGSLTSTYGLGTVAVYGLSKSAMVDLTEQLATRFAPDNIQVNCLAPGFILTPLTEQALWGTPHRRKWLWERIPAKRPAQPHELIGAALLLASEASSYLTGQLINVDGGFLAESRQLHSSADFT